MDFPLTTPFPTLPQPLHRFHNILTFSFFFTAQFTVTACCSLFRFSSYSIVRSYALRSPYLTITLTSVFLIHLSPVSGLSLSGYLIWYLFDRFPLCSLFFHRVFPLHAVFLHALNQSTALHSWRPSHLFLRFHVYVEETTPAPNPIACHILPHSPPNIHTILIIAPFHGPLFLLLRRSVHLSLPLRLPGLPSYTHTHHRR